jgi:hypothetical protein
MRQHVILGVDRGCDTHSDQALEIAKAVHKTTPGKKWLAAIVDRFDGLCLLYAYPLEPLMWPDEQRGHHFRNALAGYSGNGVITAALILEQFGFGTYEEIFDKISKGDDDAFYVFGPDDIVTRML